MVQFVLIRPGSTEYDEQGRIQGTLEIPLSKQGASEVQQLRDELKNHGIEVLYSSTCQSAWHTATAIAQELGIKVKKLDHMQNLDQGLWQGMLIEEVKQKQPTVYRQWQEQPEIICPPDGEMLSEAQARIEAALVKVLKKHKTGTIGLVVPEPLASVVQSYLSGVDIGDLWKAERGGGSWEMIQVDAQVIAHRGAETINGKAVAAPHPSSNGRK